ncbi:unnamed protein product [Effrenium voratum]|nr:unnamed protein product [Effrenium voratum]
MYPDVEADGTEWAQHFSSQQKAAEARLQQLEQQKASKKFWDDYRPSPANLGPLRQPPCNVCVKLAVL